MKKQMNTNQIKKYFTRWGVTESDEIWELLEGKISFEDNEHNRSIFYKLDIEFENGVVITKIIKNHETNR